MAGPELILTTVNCSLEQAKPKSKAHGAQFRGNRADPNIQSSSSKAHSNPMIFIQVGLQGSENWEELVLSDNCKPELKKKHVALPLGHSLRNPNN